MADTPPPADPSPSSQPTPQTPQQNISPALGTPIVGVIPPPYLPSAGGAPVILMPPGIVQAQQQVQIWQGQFPPPAAVREYNDILPGAFERMMQMAETAQQAQIDTVREAQRLAGSDTKRGQLLGFAASLCAMGGALICVFKGQPVVAGIFLSVPVMAVARALIASTRETSTHATPPVQTQKPANSDGAS